MPTVSDPAKSAALGGLLSLIESGAGASTINIYETGAPDTLLVSYNLPADAFEEDGGTAGRANLLGVPLVGSGVAAGTADKYTLANGDGVVCVTGTATLTGGGGGMQLASVDITIGQQVNLISGTLVVI